MKSFNVIWWDFNKPEPEPYDVVPHLVKYYYETSNKPETLDEFKDFIKRFGRRQWWSRCEYEMVISDWPCDRYHHKIDIYDQILINLDIIAEIVMDEIIKT